MHPSHLSELLYPRHCPFCDRLLRDDEPYLCRSCAKNIPWIRGPVCTSCGRPLDNEQGEYCGDCRKRPHLYRQGIVPFVYKGQVQESLMRFKYNGRAEYADFYARAIGMRGKESFARWKPEMTAAVPVHPSRFVRRGYNQAGVLAEKLAAGLGIPDVSGYLYRRKKTAPQKELTPADRRKNLDGAFGVRDGFRFPSRVLLVDDIYTTGATMDELAKTVRMHGAEEVWFACLASTPGEG